MSPKSRPADPASGRDRPDSSGTRGTRARASVLKARSLAEIDALMAPIEDVADTWRRLLFIQAVSSGDPLPAQRARGPAEGPSAPDQSSDEATSSISMQDDDALMETINPVDAASEGPGGDAERDRAMASGLLREAGETRDRLIADAQDQAREIMDQAREAVGREATEMRREVLAEVQRTLASIQTLAAEAVAAALAEATSPMEAVPSAEPGGTATNGGAGRASRTREDKNPGRHGRN